MQSVELKRNPGNCTQCGAYANHRLAARRMNPPADSSQYDGLICAECFSNPLYKWGYEKKQHVRFNVLLSVGLFFHLDKKYPSKDIAEALAGWIRGRELPSAESLL